MLGVLQEVSDDPDGLVIAVVALVRASDDMHEVRHGVTVDLLLEEDRCPALEVLRRREGHPNRVVVREVRTIGEVFLLEVHEGIVAVVIDGHVHAHH